MKEFLKHKKAKALMIGLGFVVLAVVGVWTGVLPKDDPETEINETFAALAALGGGGLLSALYVAAQGYSDGKSGGATATKIGPVILLALTLPLVSGCAAPEGVLKAHEDQGKLFVSVTNQHATLIDLLGVPASEKQDLIDEVKIDIDGFERVHAAMGAYLDSTDVFDQKQATEWISIIEKTRAALTGGEGD